jgi:tungstate transport system ATP-binding protein
MSASETLLEIRDLTVFRGGTCVLQIPSFTLQRNETLALIGPNGAGKSSFLLALAGLLPIKTGEILFRQKVIVPGFASTEYRRKLAMVFQEPLLFDTTVAANVAVGLKLRHLGSREINDRVKASLDRFRITHLADRSARKLSGGEAQRTSLARAFATDPEIILLDEPFVALDPPTRQSLSDDFDRVLREAGAAAILTTHEQMDALRLADRMVVMQQGKIVQSGTPSSVSNQPVNEFVATFAGIENIFTGIVTAADNGLFSIAVAGKTIEIMGNGATQEEVTICVRPEHVVISLANPEATASTRNIFTCKVNKIVQPGLYTKVYLDCGFSLVASITNRSFENMELHPGSQVFASFKATAVHIFRKGVR